MLLELFGALLVALAGVAWLLTLEAPKGFVVAGAAAIISAGLERALRGPLLNDVVVKLLQDPALTDTLTHLVEKLLRSPAVGDAVRSATRGLLLEIRSDAIAAATATATSIPLVGPTLASTMRLGMSAASALVPGAGHRDSGAGGGPAGEKPPGQDAQGEKSAARGQVA